MRKSLIGIALLSAVLFTSCSTTKLLPEGAYRLSENKVEVDDKDFNSSELSRYVTQKSNWKGILGWNPLLGIYNLSGKNEKNIFNRIIRGIGEAPVVYDPSQVDRTAENIVNHLEYMGYYGSTVDTEIGIKDRNVKVNYYVTLGKRFKIKDITYSIPQKGTFAEDFIKDLENITVKQGDYLSESALEEESSRGAAYFRELGYFGFSKTRYSFEADTLASDGYASLLMSINTFPQTASDDGTIRKYKIDSVSFAYDKKLKIRKSVLEDLNIIVPGMDYSESLINNCYSRLSALNIFNSVNISLTPSDTGKVNCDITLRNPQIQGFKINLEGSTNSTGLIGISPQLSYFHRNIFHGGELLSLSLRSNNQFRLSDNVQSNEIGASASLGIPRFLGLPSSFFRGPNIPRTDIGASFNYQNRPEYTRTIISTSYGYTGNVAKKYYFQVYPLQLNVVRLFNMDDAFRNSMASDPFMQNAYQDHFDAGVGYVHTYTTDSSPVPSSNYYYTRMGLDVSGNVLSLFDSFMPTDETGAHTIWDTPYSQYVRGEIQFGSTFFFGKNDNHSVAMRFFAGAGLAYDNSTAMPFEKLFYCGGASSMRGWQTRTLGPGNSKRNTMFVIPNQTGDMRLEANLEYRFPMIGKVIEGALFVDAGNIWSINPDAEDAAKFHFSTLGESVAANWGLGLRANLGFLIIRLDAGLRIHDPARDAGDRWVNPKEWISGGNGAWHIGVGYPF